MYQIQKAPSSAAWLQQKPRAHPSRRLPLQGDDQMEAIEVGTRPLPGALGAPWVSIGRRTPPGSAVPDRERPPQEGRREHGAEPEMYPVGLPV